MTGYETGENIGFGIKWMTTNVSFPILLSRERVQLLGLKKLINHLRQFQESFYYVFPVIGMLFAAVSVMNNVTTKREEK